MGFLPRDLGPVINPKMCAASSSWASRRDPRDRSNLAALVSLPWTIFASAIRCLPSAVLGPVLRPPCKLHFCVLLELSAGRPHCCFVRVDRAVQRRHLIRPAAVARNGVVKALSIWQVFYNAKNEFHNILKIKFFRRFFYEAGLN